MTNSLNLRIGIEHAICRRLVSELLCHQYHLAVDGDDFDIEDIKTTTSVPELLDGNDGMFNYDDVHLLVFKSQKHEGSQRKADYFVKIVFGNDGWDCISDYSTSLEKHMENTLRLCKVAEEIPVEIFETALVALDMDEK